MKEYATKYGLLKDISHPVYHKDGSLSRCGLLEPVTLQTPIGPLVPLCDFYGRRSKSDSVSFYADGSLKSICFHSQKLIHTYIGEVPAEKAIFYPSGKIKRLFPLDGAVTGFWTEQDESALISPIKININKTALNVKLIGLYFYEIGSLKSLTLWPGEIKEILMPWGNMTIRCGISFYEDGSIKSVEPAYPYPIVTPVGKIAAYDNNPLGVNGDLNSLKFFPDGQLESITTDMNLIEVYKEGKLVNIASPKLIRSFSDPQKKELSPLKLSFGKEAQSVSIDDIEYFIPDFDFKIKSYIPPAGLCGDCSSCNACG
ncbi:hypothetical protein [Alkalibacter saccharofermentans]|uniref:Uncharacterized protein n=1 Tax=Alkalibacter saccharofermentans DSM 14828 TaxID=1120975 RepID=A0A1M4WFG7_9FIRM|nr:hypothetical protein [Alkalibacter saccharofermentans]SHE79917.1 hypothetical protein SAMN02746064_01221 [Alkalibacter saccharofermentans DSM 14828]